MTERVSENKASIHGMPTLPTELNSTHVNLFFNAFAFVRVKKRNSLK